MVAPSRGEPPETALPMPRPPPVTSATRPSKLPIGPPFLRFLGANLGVVHEGSRRPSSPPSSPTSASPSPSSSASCITGSAGLLAEAAHSLADTGNQGLLLLGGNRAARRPTPEHPFGYGRERYFWAFVVALVLFSMGGLFALYEGIEKLRHPHEIENLVVAVGILLFAIVLEAFSLRTAVKEAEHVKQPDDVAGGGSSAAPSSPSCRSCCSRTPAPLIGLCFALVGVMLADGDRRPALGRRRLDRHRRCCSW